MIEWRDEGALIAARAHGEASMIVEVFTPSRGRHAGVVRGGASRKLAATMQPGTQVSVTWRARIEDHLGSFTIEPVRSRAPQVMDDKFALAGLNAVCALLSRSLPEREQHEALYERTVSLMDLLGQTDVWPLAYLHWEMALLDDLGYGLDLSACAVRGVNEDLSFISPRSGRAVSAEGAGEWAARLLPLVPVMKGEGDASGSEIARALGTTGYFVENRVFGGDAQAIPASRQRLIDAIARLS